MLRRPCRNDPATAAALNNFAVVYWNQGGYEEPFKADDGALAIRKKALGLEHPDVAASFVGVAVMYQALSRYDEALKAYGRALAIQEKALAPKHPDVPRLSRTHGRNCAAPSSPCA